MAIIQLGLLPARSPSGSGGVDEPGVCAPTSRQSYGQCGGTTTWQDEYTLRDLVWQGLGMTLGEFFAAWTTGALDHDPRAEVVRVRELLRTVPVQAPQRGPVARIDSGAD
jgi:hypothetical protein